MDEVARGIHTRMTQGAFEELLAGSCAQAPMSEAPAVAGRLPRHLCDSRSAFPHVTGGPSCAVNKVGEILLLRFPA